MKFFSLLLPFVPCCLFVRASDNSSKKTKNSGVFEFRTEFKVLVLESINCKLHETFSASPLRKLTKLEGEIYQTYARYTENSSRNHCGSILTLECHSRRIFEEKCGRGQSTTEP